MLSDSAALLLRATSKMGGERRRAAEDGASGTDMSEAGGAGSKGAGGGASLGGGTASGFTSGVPPGKKIQHMGRFAASAVFARHHTSLPGPS